MGVCYSTHNSADCCCDDPCCGLICDCCCDRSRIRFNPFSGPRFYPPPAIPAYPAFGPTAVPIIVPPAPVPPPLVPYPSSIGASFGPSVPGPIYPPQQQSQPYLAHLSLPRFPSHAQGGYIGPRAEGPAPTQVQHLPHYHQGGSRPGSRQAHRPSYEYTRQRERSDSLGRRYSSEERPFDYPSRSSRERGRTPEPPATYRPRAYRSNSTSQRVPSHRVEAEVNRPAPVDDRGNGSSSDERRHNRPAHHRSASTSARGQHHYPPDPENHQAHRPHHHHHHDLDERVPKPPRRSFDHSSREHLNLTPVHAHRQL
ncbi:hypothetical protein IAT40_007807 [Kwoniella sp. CBS 6097]